MLLIRGGLYLLGTLLLFLVVSAVAEDTGTREAELLEMMQRMEARIADLERRLEEKEAAEQDTQIRDVSDTEQLAPVETAGENNSNPSGEDFRVYWKDGLRLDSGNDNFKLKIGGRIHNDWAWHDDGDDFDIIFGDVEDGVEFRRAWIYLSGQLYRDFEFRVQYDFADGDVDFRDAWIAYRNIPGLGVLKVGQFKEPFSLEELTSSNDISLMERALPNVFAPSWNTGVQFMNSHFNDRLTWAAGVFRDTDDFGEGMADGSYNVTARVTGLPWYANDGERLLHLGASFSHRNPDDMIRLRQRPEAHMTPRYVDTGDFYADTINLYNLEAALVVDRFSVQGEYFWSDIDTELYGNVDMDGYYFQGSVFLTPDHRSYKKTAGTFGRVRPTRNFVLTGPDRGPGAWEFVARYSSLDLSDKLLLGGEETNFTLGLNWYLNPNVRVMWNYVTADVDRSPLYDDVIDVFQTRLQLSF